MAQLFLLIACAFACEQLMLLTTALTSPAGRLTGFWSQLRAELVYTTI